MNVSMLAFSSNSSNLTFPSSDKVAKRTSQLPSQVIYGIIAALAILSNVVVCIVLWRKKRTMLNKPYNILILSMAITDMMTGVVMFFTEGMVLSKGQLPAHEGFLADLYCWVFATHVTLFIFGRGSLLTVMCLSIERWVSIVKPVYFMTRFSTRRVYVYLALIWGCTFIVRADKFFTARASGTRCYRVRIMSREQDRILHIVYVILMFYIPLMITWCAFCHIGLRLRNVQWEQARRPDIARKRLELMCAITALLLTICWFPATTLSLVGKFVSNLNSFHTVQNYLLMLAMFNSCCNPWVYYFTNKEYKKEMKRLLCSCMLFQDGKIVVRGLNTGTVGIGRPDTRYIPAERSLNVTLSSGVLNFHADETSAVEVYDTNM